MRPTYAVSMTLVKSSKSSARANCQNSRKTPLVMVHWGCSRHARKKSTDVAASHRCRDAVKPLSNCQMSGSALRFVRLKILKGLVR